MPNVANNTSSFLSGSGNTSQSGVLYASGSLGTALAGPAGSLTVLGAGVTFSTAAYTNGDLYRDGTITVPIDQGNAHAFRSLMYAFGWCNYQIEFDPVIPKDSTKQLSLTFRHSWARRP